ncbi:MAG: ATP-binding protein [Gammaproteobacteria bacterium]|nr:ATP-binding protein [Gammaproteobacteria bacterium]MCP5136355.1 ATP-binding protein [Gammaproteobacteria bacterium]
MDKVDVNFGVDAQFIKNISARDITPLECIYDLIDNSIDAARNRISETNPAQPRDNPLPSSYDGYRVEINVTFDQIKISDNCKGVSRNALSESMFVTGRESHEPYSIGHFGIGLKRALLKLGRSYKLESDNGEEGFSLDFKESTIGASSVPEKAVSKKTSGRRFFTIEISSINAEVANAITQPRWTDDAVGKISARYGIIINKGFDIVINEKRVEGFAPSVRDDDLFDPVEEAIPTTSGVEIYIQTGTHEDYLMSYEKNWKMKCNDHLTDQYGWYFVCNDRVLVVADHSSRLGWKQRWHSEYYGFVGWVHFIAKDGSKLPWDTKKTDISADSNVFREVREKLHKYANDWKKKNKQLRVKPEPKGPDSPPEKPGKKPQQRRVTKISKGKGRAGDPAPEKEVVQPPAGGAISHNEFWHHVLPLGVTDNSNPKLTALINEAARVPLSLPYAASMLFRSLVEALIMDLIKTSGKYSDVKEMVFAEQEEAGRAFTDEQKSNYRFGLDPALRWLKNNPDLFPDMHRRDCGKALDKFKVHLKVLNGVVHEGDMTDSGKIKGMRDDVYPLIHYLLIRKNPS